MPRSVPLAISVQTGDPRSLAGQIMDSIRRKITAGELAVGDKLPSVRGLAEQLAINPNTVSKAYAELIADGWLQGHAGMGVFVAAQNKKQSWAKPDHRLDAAVDRFVNEVVALRCNPEEAAKRVAEALDASILRQSA